LGRVQESGILAAMSKESPIIARLAALGRGDVPQFGGKNASLGELTARLVPLGIQVPDGFATSASIYRAFLGSAGIEPPMRQAIDAYRRGQGSLEETGATIRRLFLDASFPQALATPIRAAYRALSQRAGKADAAVAVRSSATAEDLPDASFAGQQETFLNVVGETALLDACRLCFASLFTDRAIAYREAKGFDHVKVALSVGVQLMVRSDLAGSGVMFSIDTETGFPRAAVISAAWGLGETVVQGSVDPDSYTVFKPLLADPALCPVIDKRLGAKAEKLVYATGGSARTMLRKTGRRERERFVLDDAEVLQLARWAVLIEQHYGCPMDMEWAKDGETGAIFIVQARPETVQAHRAAGSMKSWRLAGKGEILATGAAIGEAIASGPACVIREPDEIARFRDGAILVATNTDPDWVPVMRRAAGIVTDHGGATSHAAIVSRELGVPAVVGTGDATSAIRDGQEITLSCAAGDRGLVYDGALPFEVEDIALDDLPSTRTRLMVNLASPAEAFRWWRLPAQGVGLARMEFIVSNLIRVHPMALVHPERVTSDRDRREIATLARGHASPSDYFVDTLARGIAKIAAVYHPHPCIVRLSDFKSNEYAHLIGGADFEPEEENPMLGFRGASRYYHERYREGFALECRALKRVREELGFTNVVAMVPFCRTPAEADRVLAEMAANGLERGGAGLEVYVMAEIPSNVVLAEEFAARFDGFSIGSNDLTQLLLGVDRDSDLLAPLFDERDPAVTRTIADLIRRAHARGAKVGICGQAPSNYPEFAAFLVEQGIESISLNPDSFVATLRRVAEAERGRG
jgi:pyruvate,water dikinase